VLGPGIYGISNHLLDTPWPKITRTKEAFRRWCEKDGGSDNFDDLLTLLHDTDARLPTAELPSTGITLEREADAVAALHRQRRTTAHAARRSRPSMTPVERCWSAASIQGEWQPARSSTGFTIAKASYPARSNVSAPRNGERQLRNFHSSPSARNAADRQRELFRHMAERQSCEDRNALVARRCATIVDAS
jgi:hypothetical protein